MPYIEARLGLPQPDILTGKTNDVSSVVHDARACAASTDIDADVVVPLRVQLVVRIHGHLPRLLPRGLSVGH